MKQFQEGGKATGLGGIQASAGANASFASEFAHGEMKGSMKGGKDSGVLRTPVSGPNPDLKVQGKAVSHEPTQSATDVPYFMYNKSYMAAGNSEMQGKAIKDIPLNDFSSEDAKI